MKVKGLPYDFEVELAHVKFRDAVKSSKAAGSLPAEVSSSPTTRLLLDAEAELLLVQRGSPQGDVSILVPLSNVASMEPEAK